LHNKDTDWAAFIEEVKEKVVEARTHNGWDRERDVKERDENFIQIIKGCKHLHSSTIIRTHSWNQSTQFKNSTSQLKTSF
jgi:hypothetical protein